MELRQLQHFVAVAEEQHFTRAAARVHIVQSALSASVRALEDELGTKLFVRTTRQVRLTAAGQAFLERARRALEEVREAKREVEALTGLKRGILSIGTVQSLPAFLDLPALLSDFHALHPGVEVHLSQGSSSVLLEKVQSARLDLAFLPLCEAPIGVETSLIACEAMVVISAPSHKLVGRNNLTLHDLRDEPFIDFAGDWGTRRLIDRAFSEAGVERHIAFEVSDLTTLLDLAERGMGVALIPEAIAACRSSLAVTPLAEPEICWELVVAHLVGEKAQAGPVDDAPRAFLELLNAQRAPLLQEAG